MDRHAPAGLAMTNLISASLAGVKIKPIACNGKGRKQVKQAKQHSGAHGHQACSNCARTIRIRGDSNKVACTARLQMMPANHSDHCEDYKAVATTDETTSPVIAVIAPS